MLKFIFAAGLMLTGTAVFAAIETMDDAQTEAGLEDDLATLPAPGLEAIDTANSALEAELQQSVDEEIKQFAAELDVAAATPETPAAPVLPKSKKSKTAKAGKSSLRVKDKSL